jgi:cytochrome c553
VTGDLLILAAPTYVERVKALFEAHPGEWIHWSELADVGGRLAWRTRCSECHVRYGMTIEAKVIQRPDGVKDSYRRWVRQEA